MKQDNEIRNAVREAFNASYDVIEAVDNITDKIQRYFDESIFEENFEAFNDSWEVLRSNLSKLIKLTQTEQGSTGEFHQLNFEKKDQQKQMRFSAEIADLLTCNNSKKSYNNKRKIEATRFFEN